MQTSFSSPPSQTVSSEPLQTSPGPMAQPAPAYPAAPRESALVGFQSPPPRPVSPSPVAPPPAAEGADDDCPCKHQNQGM